jgi:MoaA/NifB/PqqE/SkfB family radical SAM enzyme
MGASVTFKSLETREIGAGHVRAIEIGVTSRCNFRCSYCGAYDLLERRVLSLDDVAQVIDTLPDLERVKLSGGEVLLEFDICTEIVGYCTARGIATQINSNGTLLTEEKFRGLEEAGLDVLHVSLNHTDAAGHAAFYQVTDKMFPKIVYAIERGVASSTIDTVVETILFDETEHTIDNVHRFIAARGVRKHEIQMEIPSVHQSYRNTLGKDRILAAIARLAESREPSCVLFFSCLSAYFQPGSDQSSKLRQLFADPGVVYASCIEGKAQLHLHSNGDVMICELGCPEVIGNVFDQSMLTIYETSARLKQFIERKHEQHSFSCFRHVEFPGQNTGNTPAVPLPLPRVRG